MSVLEQVFTFPTMVTGASITSALELPGNFVYVSMEVTTMTAYSAITPIYLLVSSDGVTYRRFSNPENNTTPVGANDFSIASSVSNRFVNLPSFGFRYVKAEVSATVTSVAGVLPTPFKLVCVSNQ